MLANMGLKIGPDRLQDRRSLLEAFDSIDRTIDKSGLMNGMDGFQQQMELVRPYGTKDHSGPA